MSDQPKTEPFQCEITDREGKKLTFINESPEHIWTYDENGSRYFDPSEIAKLRDYLNKIEL